MFTQHSLQRPLSTPSLAQHPLKIILEKMRFYQVNQELPLPVKPCNGISRTSKPTVMMHFRVTLSYYYGKAVSNQQNQLLSHWVNVLQCPNCGDTGSQTKLMPHCQSNIPATTFSMHHN
jgi:hypothetical protein